MNPKIYWADEGHVIVILQCADGTTEYVCLKTDSTMFAGVLANLTEPAAFAAAHECGLIGYTIGEVSSDTLPDGFGYLKTGFPPEEQQIRVIDEHYQTRFFLSDGANMAIATLNKVFAGKVHYLDPYHFSFANDVYHICQFAEMCSSIGGHSMPEPIIRDEQAAWSVAGKGYLLLQNVDDAYDYTLYDERFNLLDGGIIDTDADICCVRDEILADFKWNDRLLEVTDYEELADRTINA